MAVRAFFSDIGMLVNEWTLVLHMTTGAKGFCGDALNVALVGRKMWVVAVGAGHFMFRNRVMRELGELHLGLCVATGTELFLFVPTDFLLRSFVQLVAVEAADIIQCMHAGIPAGQVLC